MKLLQTLKAELLADPSVRTVQRYASATGTRAVLRLVQP